MKKIIKWVLILSALVPLVVASTALVPYVSGKTLYFRGLIGIVSVLAAALFFQSAEERRSMTEKVRALFKRPVGRAIAVSYGLLVVSTIFAFDRYIAFFGNVERGEGLIGLTFFYLFFLFTSIFFDKKDWNAFFVATLASGWVLFIVQLYQALAEGVARSGSLTGNPIYLGAYFLFVVYASLMLIARNKKGESTVPLFVSIVSLAMSFLSILMSQDRSVMLGAFIAAIFALGYLAFVGKGMAFSKKHDVRAWAAGALIAIAVLGGGFAVTRHADVWQHVPGLNRLADFNGTDTDSTARLVVAEITFRAVDPAHSTIGRTLVGWGWDNYIYAWEKNYDPKLYGLDTGVFDRAHDKLLDQLVMTGVLGLIAYLVMWALFIGAALKLGKKRAFEAAITLFFAIAFFLQNLTVFDSFVTYLAFFAVLASTIYESRD